MYQHYWQFERMPFENHCDSTFFFAGRSHEAALLKLQFLAEQSKGAAARRRTRTGQDLHHPAIGELSE